MIAAAAALMMFSGLAHGDVAMSTFTFQVAWYPTIEYGPFYYGQEHGYFADEGIHLDFPRWQLGMNGVEEVAKGHADMGMDDAVNFLISVDSGADLVAIYGYMQETPLVLVSLRDKLDGIDDLAGKKVATVKGFQYLVDYFRLKYPRLKDKVHFELLNDNLGALERGDADVGIFFETAQVPLLKLRGYPLHILRYQDIGYDVYSHVIFVRRDFYNAHREALARFVRALDRSIRKSFNDPVSTTKLFTDKVKYTDFVEGPFKDNEDYTRYQEACFKILHYYMAKGVGENYGLMNPLRWEAMIANLRELGILNHKIDAERVFTNDLVKELYAAKAH